MRDEDWRKVWVTRGKDYHSANAVFPAAREAERDLLMDRLELRAEGLTLLDVAAGGGLGLPGEPFRSGIACHALSWFYPCHDLPDHFSS